MENGRYKTFSYEITTDPSFMDEQNAMTPWLQKIMDPLFSEITANRGGKNVIDKLLKLIEKYPQNPQLKNFLSVAYNNMGDTAKAREVNHWIQAEHPDYLFGKLNLAAQYYEDGEYEKIPEILGNLMDIQGLYPHRHKFHLAEVTGFNKIAILYFLATDNLEAARARYEIMQDIAPDHPDTEFISLEMMKANMEKHIADMEERKKNEISVTQAQKSRPPQLTEPPALANPIVNQLYENGLYIDPALISEILSLPRESLVNDLELLINDLLSRYDFFKKGYGDHDLDMDDIGFAIHAIFMLGELRAESSLPKVLEVLKQDDEFLDFWFGDHITESIWEPLYYMGNQQLGLLQQFIQLPGIDTYIKSVVADVVNQIAYHQPERKEDILNWYKEAFLFFINSKIEENIIDSEALGFLIGNVIELQATSLIPEIKKLFELGYVSVYVAGTLEDILRDIKEKPAFDHKRDLTTISEKYHQITSTWASYTEADDEPMDDDFMDTQQIMPVKTGPKVGRNDPCPCGSGKKYKNCCLKKGK